MENNYGTVKISAGFSQILLVATDVYGNVVAWDSAVFTSKTATELSYNSSKTIAVKLKELGIDNVDIVVKGSEKGIEPALKALIDNGININTIKDKTPIPHNGVFPLARSRRKSKTL